jgi:trigger factor
MQVQIESLSPVEKKLAVTMPWAYVQTKLEAAIREAGKTARVKGYRPGKVPRSLIERMYGRQIQAEVTRDLVQEGFVTAARENKLAVVAEPVVEDVKFKTGEPFTFSMRIEVRADFTIDNVDGMTATKPKVSIAETDVDGALERLRRQHTDFLPISERTEAAATDVVVIHLKGKIGDRAIDRPEVLVDLTDHSQEPLPGLAEALLGIPFDAKDKPLKLTFAADHKIKELAGQTAELTITVRDARQKQVPALDDEFAKDVGVGEATTLDGLKDALRKDLLAGKQAQADREGRGNVLKAFIAANPIPVAPALVERGIDLQLDRTRYQLAMQGIDMDKAGVDLSGMRGGLRDSALEEVRGQLLLDALADREQLTVSDPELDIKIAALAEEQNKPPGKLKAEMTKDGRLDNLRWQLRQEKALDHVVSRATITEREPEPAASTDAPESK